MRNMIRRWLGLVPLEPQHTGRANWATASPIKQGIGSDGNDAIIHNSRAAYEAFLIDNGYIVRVHVRDPGLYDSRVQLIFCKDMREVSDALIRHATQQKLAGITSSGPADPNQYTLPGVN